MSYYDDQGSHPNSPGLVPAVVKPARSSSPAGPHSHTSGPSSNSECTSTSSSSHHRQYSRRGRRRKSKPSQGDTVLLGMTAPHLPDVAREAGKKVWLEDSGSDSSSEDSDEDERMETETDLKPPLPAHQPPLIERVGSTEHDLATTAQAALQRALDFQLQDGAARSGEQQSYTVPQANGEPNGLSCRRGTRGPRKATQVTTTISRMTANNSQTMKEEMNAESLIHCAAKRDNSCFPRMKSPISAYCQSKPRNPQPGFDSYTSRLPEHSLPSSADSDSSSSHKLPAMKPGSSDGQAGSPVQSHNLPGFGELGLNELAEAASHDHEARMNGHPTASVHRQSFSSSAEGGLRQSPTLVSGPFSGVHASPTTMYAQYQGQDQRSPSSTYGAMHPGPLGAYTDGVLPQSSKTYPHSPLYHHRKPSQASDFSSAQYTLPSQAASISSNHLSTDGHTPSSHCLRTPSEHDISVDAVRRTLLPPLPNGGIPAPFSVVGYKCMHAGCTAAPFQTQYLLNSHANVHSSARPHYCPVPGCPRAEGGKGFKRKNEMIRHGLVHESPGYACPFCPEREHKYPRPDNLQRHVHVHHGDRDKDDPALREVLAQKAKGGSKGRRRRLGP